VCVRVCVRVRVCEGVCVLIEGNPRTIDGAFN
jgi:NADPH-dependent glutamate synthase beta subunit-like oxidoreductase